MAERATIKHTTLQGIADAIRTKTGKIGKLLPSAMAQEILGITTGVDTSDATLASGASMLNGVTAYGKAGTKITGTIPSKAAATHRADFASKTIIQSGYYLSGAQNLSGAPQTVEITTSNLALTSDGIVIDLSGFGWNINGLYAIGVYIRTTAGYMLIAPLSMDSSGAIKLLTINGDGLTLNISSGIITLNKDVDYSALIVSDVVGSVTVW